MCMNVSFYQDFVKSAYKKILDMLWILKIIVSMRWFFVALKTYVKTDGYEKFKILRSKILFIETY